MIYSKFKFQLLMILLLPFGLFLNKLSQLSPLHTENLYSMGLYKTCAPILSKISGFFSFSVAEFVIITLVLALIYGFSLFCMAIYSHDSKLFLLKNTFLNILALAGTIYFLFLLMWGFNYNRLPLATIMDLDVKVQSTSTLASMCAQLISSSNKLRGQLLEDNKKNLVIADGYEGVLVRSQKAFYILAGIYPQFSNEYGKAKAIILSTPMSYTHIWGIFTFYTGEANVNSHVPLPFYPSTVIHEMAHQHGFAREDEANFISYLVCSTHPDKDFQYSGYLLALTNSLNQLQQNDKIAYKKLSAQISPEIKRDLNTSQDFSKKYKGPLSDFSTKTNDLYLKANNQKEGEKSYGKMVDLLIAYYHKTH